METATKQDLMHLENRIDAKMNDLENRMDAKIDSKMNHLEKRLLEQMRNIETSLLTEFRKWAIPISARLRTCEASDAGLIERVGLLEERMDALDRRNPAH